MDSTDLKPEVKEIIQETILKYPDLWKNATSQGYVAAYVRFCRDTGQELSRAAMSGAGCHYGFYELDERQVAVNGHRPDCHGQHPEYVKWVCREGPFAHGVLNRDNEDEILNHASVLDGFSIGKGGCLWTAKALRYTTEDKFRVPFWYHFREQGLDGLQAFIGCSILTSDGYPSRVATHNSLVSYGSPAGLRRIYDELKGMKRNDTIKAVRLCEFYGDTWGSLSGKKVKKSDGWGGFTEVLVPGDAKEFCSQLKEIFEGDPKNVK